MLKSYLNYLKEIPILDMRENYYWNGKKLFHSFPGALTKYGSFIFRKLRNNYLRTNKTYTSCFYLTFSFKNKNGFKFF